MLDSAVMRPGRLDQLVYLPLPDLECRRAIFGAATRKSPLAADISRSSWAPLPIFDLIGREGAVERGELERTFNMGIGMVAVVPPDAVEPAIALLRQRGVEAWACGDVRDRLDCERGDSAAKGVEGGAVSLVGEHPAP